MNLQEFIEKVLVEVNAAVDGARRETSRDIRFAENQSKRTIEFDIAVSVENNSAKSGKAAIKVLQFAEAGGQLSAESKNSTVSRVTFGLHITPFTKAENEQMDSEIRHTNELQEY
jgi:hypothetical protein